MATKTFARTVAGVNTNITYTVTSDVPGTSREYQNLSVGFIGRPRIKVIAPIKNDPAPFIKMTFPRTTQIDGKTSVVDTDYIELGRRFGGSQPVILTEENWSVFVQWVQTDEAKALFCQSLIG